MATKKSSSSISSSLTSSSSSSSTVEAAPPIGRYLLTVVGLFTSIACYIADFNETHVYNPTWPGHAKFHNGQTMSMGLLLGLLTLYYTWRPSYNHDSLVSACLIGSLYWITQASSILYPGATLVDPPSEAAPQPIIIAVTEVVIGAAYWLESARLGGNGIVDGAKRRD